MSVNFIKIVRTRLNYRISQAVICLLLNAEYRVLSLLTQSICPSVDLEQLQTTERIFITFYIGEFHEHLLPHSKLLFLC
jgi:hypothetical protein